MKHRITNPDLLEERAKKNFDQREMTEFLFGKEQVKYVEKITSYCEKYPEIVSGIDYYEMTREEKFRTWWERIRVLMKDDQARDLFLKNDEHQLNKLHFSWSFIFPGQSPITLHQAMFTDSLSAFGTDEQ